MWGAQENYSVRSIVGMCLTRLPKPAKCVSPSVNAENYSQANSDVSA